ncbi:MAG: 6-carboxytetrahydropterin synthase, partial [Clostridiales bacterium]|nr:6-carboxytetrahydropterin synthase [Clostridiales bacterium]
MYSIRAEQSFDAAHFLAGYQGKCSNIHGHRWRVVVQVGTAELDREGQLRGMVADFGDLKRELKSLTDAYDHTFIYESGSLREKTVEALEEEGFSLTGV